MTTAAQDQETIIITNQPELPSIKLSQAYQNLKNKLCYPKLVTQAYKYKHLGVLAMFCLKINKYFFRLKCLGNQRAMHYYSPCSGKLGKPSFPLEWWALGLGFSCPRWPPIINSIYLFNISWFLIILRLEHFSRSFMWRVFVKNNNWYAYYDINFQYNDVIFWPGVALVCTWHLL